MPQESVRLPAFFCYQNSWTGVPDACLCVSEGSSFVFLAHSLQRTFFSSRESCCCSAKAIQCPYWTFTRIAPVCLLSPLCSDPSTFFHAALQGVVESVQFFLQAWFVALRRCRLNVTERTLHRQRHTVHVTSFSCLWT
eukprot:TRINITY_DN35292_c0_g2_i1.p1 TRINITY_DN35292_c0_g2~~TRINITY_DN35292_c0_g2_i1.p1  ORF type:complete len:138 (+),score=3.84 TRINITY_DN35292_c0_g2_i1:205-618(+)